MTLLEAIASTIVAYKNCKKTGSTEWEQKHFKRLTDLAKALPSGSGFDSGTTVDVDASSDRCIVLHTSFHHMDEHGFYDGWTEHLIRIISTFSGPDVRISGPDRNEIKDYITDTMLFALEQPTASALRIESRQP
jgi:hypothetical protein